MSTKKKAASKKKKVHPDIRLQINQQRKIVILQGSENNLKKRNKILMEELKKADILLKSVKVIKSSREELEIKPKINDGSTSEATAVIVASDWHIEEKVDLATVNNLNHFNLEIANLRAQNFFRNSVRLIEISDKEILIKTIILALLGDFITNDIHDELAESNYALPTKAIMITKGMLISGIEYLLANTRAEEIIIPCHSGNHGRTTPKVHISTEAGHSLEYLLFHMLAEYFKNEKRLKFIISEGYHSYVTLKGFRAGNNENFVIRFHHGHALKYQGGVGGIFIPTFKSIAQWNKAKHADLDVFGHFHQRKDGGNFLSNGSLIGWNPFAISIKADFELPQQTFFLVDKKRGKTIVAPISLE